jgi:hypothetical protein
MARSGDHQGFLHDVGGVTRAVMLLVLASSASAGRIEAQDTTYVPTTDMPNGKQIVAVYFGAKACGPCQTPTMKAAIRRMKPLVAGQARKSGASFAAMVVAVDRKLEDGLEFIKPLGAFDEYVFGSDMASSAAQRFIWSDTLASPVMPQVIVVERNVEMIPHTSIKFGPDRVLRVVAGDSVPIWVAAGAPIR